MISTIILGVLLAASLFSAENLVVTIAGAAATYVGTNLIKNATGIYRIAAFLVTVLVSMVVAAVALVVSSYMGGTGLSLEAFAKSMPQIFTLATIAYKVITEFQPEDN